MPGVYYKSDSDARHTGLSVMRVPRLGDVEPKWKIDRRASERRVEGVRRGLVSGFRIDLFDRVIKQLLHQLIPLGVFFSASSIP
jgi:hypothetical protein